MFHLYLYTALLYLPIERVIHLYLLSYVYGRGIIFYERIGTNQTNKEFIYLDGGQ